MKVKLLEPIEGFEDVAEYRVPRDGEAVYSPEYNTVTSGVHWIDEKLILTPIKRWRPATIDDAVRASSGEKVIARFRENYSTEWTAESCLMGIRIQTAKGSIWYSDSRGWDQCEVLDA